MTGQIDLSTLPPEVRRKVEAGLAKLSPEARRQWEKQGSPLLAKLMSGLVGAGEAVRSAPPPAPGAAPDVRRPTAQPARSATDNVSAPREEKPSPVVVIGRTPPHGHYNDTIAPGDRPGLVQRLLLGLAIAGLGLWWLL